MLAAAALGGTSACSTREASARADVEETSGEQANQPEQVVQTIRTQSVETPRTGAAGSFIESPNTERADTSETASEPRAALGEASAAGASRADGSPLPPRAGAAGTITTKHLEAELNRLEAELAN
jgi:hypothetical protein